MKLANVERIILASGDITPSVIMQAIKADIKKEIGQALDTLCKMGKVVRTVWLAVDESGAVWVFSRRPKIDLAFGQFFPEHPGVAIELFNMRDCISCDLFDQLRMGIYYTEYLAEINAKEFGF